ncbi:MAG: DUF1003 domain-containing protein [Bacteroidetes bacterium]|nr:DUF1003 domain-containing protein [Fibrella sp.]
MLTQGQKLSDRVAQFSGSRRCLVPFGIIPTGWIILNGVVISHYKSDPYPFISVNLILFCITAFQAPLIMTSQNRRKEKDRTWSESNYLINLKAAM